MGEFDEISYSKASKNTTALAEMSQKVISAGSFQIVTDLFTATAGQTVFNLSGGKSYDTDKPVKVWIDGILTFAIGGTSDSFARTSATSFTMNAGVDEGAEVLFEGFHQSDYAGMIIVPVSGNKTLALSDGGTYQNVTAATIITVPTNVNVAFPIGTDLVVFKDTAAEIAFVAADGVNIKSDSSYLKVGNQNTCAYLKKVAADTWHLSGSLKA